MIAPDAKEVLQVALAQLRRDARVPVAFGGEVPSGGRAVRLSATLGTQTRALHGLVVGAGSGLGGRVIVTARPYWVDDYVADPRISHEYDVPVSAEQLRSLAAMPVVVDRSVRAVIYAGHRERQPLGERSLDAMARVARRLGIELAVQAEVNRRVAELETEATLLALRRPRTPSEWENVREAHAELRTLAAEVGDTALRDRIQGICDRLRAPGAPAAGPTLTPRETDVLALVALGLGNAEVARRLRLLPETVKSYLHNASRKLGSRGRVETVSAARRHGLLP